MVEVSMITLLFLTATTFVDYLNQMNDQTFDTIPEDWTISPSIASPISICNGYSLLGGYGKIGQGIKLSATFTNIPLHTKVRVKFKSYAIDSWDKETVYYKIQNDDYSRAFDLLDGPGSICGNGYFDQYFNEVFEISHSSDTLSVIFTTGLDEDPFNESWGFRDFVIQILPVQCVQLYSECNYQGTMIEFCQGQPIQGKVNQPKIIKSVKLHGSGYLTLMKNNIEIVTLKQNNPCLDEYEFPKLEYKE